MIVRATALATAVVVLGLGGTAFAHTALRSSNPPAGALVGAAPRVVVLTFNEPVRPRTVTVRDSRSRNLVVSVTRDARDARRIRARVRVGAGGLHRVRWTVLGADGHPVSGAYAFRVR